MYPNFSIINLTSKKGSRLQYHVVKLISLVQSFCFRFLLVDQLLHVVPNMSIKGLLHSEATPTKNTSTVSVQKRYQFLISECNCEDIYYLLVWYRPGQHTMNSTQTHTQ